MCDLHNQWSSRAEELAAWTWDHLVNRPDAWGGYYSKTEDGETKTCQTTHPAKTERGKVYLTPEDIESHFKSSSTDTVIGLHSTSMQNTSLWGGLDIDKHGDGGDADANLKAALAWYGRLLEIGFHPLLTSSNGRGGYHLRVLFSRPASTQTVYSFLKNLAADYAAYGLTAPPESFPKQAEVTEKNPYGNWMRLPGRHHTSEFWSEVWNGSAWLSGIEAIDHILSLTGDPASLIPVDLPARIAAYMATLPNRAEGQGRDNVAYNFAAWLVRDMKLTDADALPWMEAWDKKNDPPKGTERLKEIIANAHTYGKNSYGSGLNGNRVNGNGNANATPKPKEAATPKTSKPELDIPDPRPWPTPPDDIVYSGIAGQIVKTIEPQTEADPVAILIQFLAMFGNAAGRNAYWQVENDRHYANLYVCLVGETAKGRKGTSMGRARQAFDSLGDDWVRKRISSGLSSGEGLITAVRDAQMGKEPIKQGGQVIGHADVEIDPGVSDKRLLVVEPEFGRVLRVMEREGNTLSPRLREGWDSGNLTNMTKAASKATGAHISLICHVTLIELLKLLTDVETANGLANRFLWTAVRRSKLLPLGGSRVDLGVQSRYVQEALQGAIHEREVPFDSQARQYWNDDLYAKLTAPRGGILGAVTNRAEAQVRRLALIYALLDQALSVELPHLRAALALWSYCERSCYWMFGEATGDNVADEILSALRSAGNKGLTQTEIRAVFSGHQPSERIGQALAVLIREKLAHCEIIKTPGRSAKRWTIGLDPSLIAPNREEAIDVTPCPIT